MDLRASRGRAEVSLIVEGPTLRVWRQRFMTPQHGLTTTACETPQPSARGHDGSLPSSDRNVAWTENASA